MPKSANTVSLDQLIHLEKETTKTSLAIRKIRIALERGDITEQQACTRLKRAGFSITPP
jgi:hypothetical protein